MFRIQIRWNHPFCCCIRRRYINRGCFIPYVNHFHKNLILSDINLRLVLILIFSFANTCSNKNTLSPGRRQSTSKITFSPLFWYLFLTCRSTDRKILPSPCLLRLYCYIPIAVTPRIAKRFDIQSPWAVQIDTDIRKWWEWNCYGCWRAITYTFCFSNNCLIVIFTRAKTYLALPSDPYNCLKNLDARFVAFVRRGWYAHSGPCSSL